MAKSTRSLEERIQEKNLRAQKLIEQAKKAEAQAKQLAKRQQAEERKKRTHRLIEVGAAVESVLDVPIEEEDIPRLIAFLKKQEANGKFFSKAMQKNPDTDMD
ncbi:DUF3847 domain-containing protein [Novisyntrophococcus fermenticellae]|uniref:DUF3847 domain-containing protein n=1 Tax=Novisyntrophococcus fermenticellae TaxID=2068655 RepID=UPI001E384EDB|nr:DUF3847 domain-containing protein [Novisyntrophococcus fermenticellae]